MCFLVFVHCFFLRPFYEGLIRMFLLFPQRYFSLGFYDALGCLLFRIVVFSRFFVSVDLN